MSTRVLFVDDERVMCESVAVGLSTSGFSVTWRTSANEASDLMTTDDFDVVVTDLNMRGVTGIDLCQRVVASRPDVPVIVITAFGSLETAVAAIRAGAFDFVTKPFDLGQLVLTVERAARHRALCSELSRLKRLVRDGGERDYPDLVGDSAAMKKVRETIDRLRDSASTVLLTGESGTGKEMVARALHRSGKNPSGPFIAVNSAGMPETLLESELFGHAKGAFTDARTARKGLFVEASGGTLFLDEIGEMPLAIQPKLLRALEERRVRPVGGNTELAFDARIIAATNVDLETAISERRFREDLYYRVNVVHLELPSLRERGTDVLPLAQHFLEQLAERAQKRIVGFSRTAAERLLSYQWPGNVRELRNCIERAIVLARFDQLTVDDLPERIRSYRAGDLIIAGADSEGLPTLGEVESRYVRWVMESVGGNRTKAARILGLDRSTLWRKLERESLGAGDEGNPSP